MPVYNLNKWATILCGFLMIVLGLPASGFSEGACTCADISKVEQRLKEVEAQLAAWEQVANEGMEKLFATAGWAQGRFVEIAFPGQVPRQRGVQKYGEPPQVSPEEKQNNCDSIWQATQKHEEDHAKYDRSVADWYYTWTTILGHEGLLIAAKEIRGHYAEAKYLQEQLDKLKKDCEPKPVLSGSPNDEQRKEMQAEQQHQIAKAATRVTAYANSLK